MISIGIDIGSYSVKVARVEGSAKGFKALSLDEYPLPTDLSKDTTLDIIEILRDIHKHHNDEGTHFVIGCEQNHISSRRRSFPFKERHKIIKSLPFELEDDIPLSFENAIFEAKLTHFSEGTANVLALACPKEHIVQQIQRMNDAGIDANILSTEGVAIGNLFEDWLEAPPEIVDTGEFEREPAKASMVLQIGHSKTVCSVLKDGYTLDTFTMDWGGYDLAQTISLKYSIHYLEALKELRQKAFILTHHEGVTREQITLSDILKAEVDKLANQLRLAVAEMETEYHIKIEQGILCGGVAQLRNLGPYLTQRLEFPINRLSHIANLENLDFSSNPNNEISHIVSIGLAAEGVKRPKNPAVSFLRGEFARQNESFQALMKQWGPLVTTAVSLFAIFLVWAILRSGITEEMVYTAEDNLKSQAKKIMNERRPSTRKIKDFIRDQKRKVKQIEVFESLQGVNSALDVLGKISDLAPGKANGALNVTQLSVRNNDILIIGYTDKEQMISQFQESLKSYSNNGVVEIQTAPPGTPPGQKGFSLKFSAQRREGGQ